MHVEYLQSSNDLVPQFPSFSFFFFFFFFILIIPTAVVLDTSRKERERTLGGPVWSQALDLMILVGHLQLGIFYDSMILRSQMVLRHGVGTE